MPLIAFLISIWRQEDGRQAAAPLRIRWKEVLHQKKLSFSWCRLYSGNEHNTLLCFFAVHGHNEVMPFLLFVLDRNSVGQAEASQGVIQFVTAVVCAMMVAAAGNVVLPRMRVTALAFSI